MIRIKKYGNRRLYNTEASRYLNLDELAQLVADGETVQISDATTGEDLTRSVLLQIVLEVQHGAALFPSGLLHRIIRAGGDHPGQRMLLQQLGQALSLLDAQLMAMEDQFPWMKGAMGAAGRRPGAPRTETPPSREPPPEEQAPPPSPEPAPKADNDAELAALRARLASLEARLKKS